MVEIEEDHHPPHRDVDAADIERRNIVSNGETSATGEPDDYEDMFSATDEDLEDDERHPTCHHWNVSDLHGEVTASTNRNSNATDLFYDENLDEEDEAYVYKHLRGGIRETVTVNATSNTSPNSAFEKLNYQSNNVYDDNSVSANETISARRQQMVQMFKPRHSDTVLSCPCCFNIVCMDCQKHKRYANQYRAMFVMGVVVDWKHILVYDEIHRALVSKIEQNAIESDEWHPADTNEEPSLHANNQILRANNGEFYAVECDTCRTQVAALDMTYEIYYFHGCLESSSAF